MTDEQKALIKETAREVANEFEVRLNRRMDEQILAHTSACKAERSTGALMLLVSFITSAIMLFGNWIFGKFDK